MSHCSMRWLSRKFTGEQLLQQVNSFGEGSLLFCDVTGGWLHCADTVHLGPTWILKMLLLEKITGC